MAAESIILYCSTETFLKPDGLGVGKGGSRISNDDAGRAKLASVLPSRDSVKDRGRRKRYKDTQATTHT